MGLVWKDGRIGPSNLHKIIDKLVGIRGELLKILRQEQCEEMKKLIAEKIALDFRNVYVFVRTAKGVMAKINYVEKAWKKVYSWAGETGQCVKEKDPERYDMYLRNLCKH